MTDHSVFFSSLVITEETIQYIFKGKVNRK